MTISEPTAVAISILGSTDVNCFGGADGTADADATGGTAGYTYAWSSGGSAAAETGLIAGTYTVISTDLNGCQDSTTVTITEPTELLSSTATTPASCGSSDGTATVTATGGTIGYSYEWLVTPTQTTATATGLPSGTYSVVTTDLNGCTVTSSATIVDLNAPIASIIESGEVACNGGDDGYAIMEWVNGTGPFLFSGLTVPHQILHLHFQRELIQLL